MGSETTPLGRTLKYTATSDSTYEVAYGMGKLLRKLGNDFSCDVPSYARPNFVSENKHFLFVSSGCGTGCRIGHILPLDINQKEITFPNWIAQDLEKNLVLSVDRDFNENLVFFKLLNVKTKEEIIYRPSNLCDYANPTDCLSKVKIETDKIIINWSKGLKHPPFIISLKD